MRSYLKEIRIWFLNKKRESSHSNFNRSFPNSLIISNLNQNFPTSSVTFQLRLSFPTSVRTFPLQPEFSTFRPTFLLHSFQFHVGLSKLKLSNFSFFSNCSLQLYISLSYTPKETYNAEKAVEGQDLTSIPIQFRSQTSSHFTCIFCSTLRHIWPCQSELYNRTNCIFTMRSTLVPINHLMDNLKTE